MAKKVKIHCCGTYHPYWILGERNPNAGDSISCAMMDFKSEDNSNHNRAIQFFSKLIIEELDRNFMGKGDQKADLSSIPFEIAIVPSHEAGKISPALQTLSYKICQCYRNGMFNQSLKRQKTVPSAHKENGDRSVEHHMSTIEVVTDVQNKVILLIDDVTTTGGSMTACANLLKSGGAKLVLALALLETASYEG